jgi:hypothetical protein
MTPNLIEEILNFLDTVMKKDPSVQRQILGLLKKHFDNFREDLARMDSPPESETAEASDETDAALSDDDKEDDYLSIPDYLTLSEEELRNQWLLQEIFLPPLSEREDDEFF